MIVREATSDDMGFVCETFLRSIRQLCTHVEGLDNSRVVRLLTNLLASDWAATVCESEELLIGWAVHKPKNHLAWMYVRSSLQGQGVARYILTKVGVNSEKPVISPFLPNRDGGRFRGQFRINFRPYECVT
jgi:hypothetical protein